MLGLLLAETGHAQSTPPAWPDPRTRVDIRFDDAQRQANARTVRVRDSQCRENIADLHRQKNLRQTIVDLAAREWEAFHFPVLDIASANLPVIPSLRTAASGTSGHAIVPGPLNPKQPDIIISRMLRNGLSEDDGSVAARIGGYWAIVPNAGAIATQNVIWGKGGWPGAGWAQPWSAAFISWIMCEAGLTREQFNRAPSHAQYLAAFFRKASASAYSPKPLSEKPEVGDLLCTGRDNDTVITNLDEAESVARNDALMHCDVIVRLLPDRILLIGGNVQNAVTMSVVPRTPQGTARPTQQRAWFGLMKLNAPSDSKAGLARTQWRCLGQKKNIQECLKNL